MKKFLSILLIISMMMSTMVVIFSGTVTALASESNAITATAANNNDDDAENIRNSIVSVIRVFKALWDMLQKTGGIGVLLDACYALLEQIGVNINGMYDWLKDSGVVEWLAHLFFPQ